MCEAGTCIREEFQSMVVLWNLSNPQGNEDRIAGKGLISMVHDNLVHQLIPMFQATKSPDAKAAVDKEWTKLETIPSLELEKVKSKKEVVLEAQRNKRKVQFATLLDICHSKNAELQPKLQKYKGRVVLRGDIVKRRLWSLRSFVDRARLRSRWAPQK